MAIRGTKIAAVADDGNAATIQPSEMDPFTLPVSPQQKDLYIEVIGDPPASGSSIAIKIYWNTQWITVVSSSY